MKRLLIDKENIAKEVFDNEAVMINIPHGKYYSVRGEAGLRVLEVLDEPATQESIIAVLLNEFEVSEVDARSNVKAFLSQLENEEMLTASSEVRSNNSHYDAINQKLPFVKLELEVYDDMQELLLVDPVHDVTSFKGWPEKRDE